MVLVNHNEILQNVLFVCYCTCSEYSLCQELSYMKKLKCELDAE